MMRSFITAVAIVLPGVLGILGPRPAMLAAQEVQLAMRGPRFYQAPSAKAAAVEIDVRSSSLLRTSISLNFERATVGDVLAAIEKQTGVTFIYSRRVVAVDRPVRVRAERITVAGALTEILVDAGIDVFLKGNQLALVERPQIAVRRTGTIAGRVTDAKTQQPVVDAEVRLEGTRWKTATDTGGRYRLADVDSGAYTLTMRRPGYGKQSQPVTVGTVQEQTVDVVMTPLAVKLDELVTTATGPQRRRDIGNAITTIKADSIMQAAPIRSLTDLLENRVPGLTVQHTSGAPGDPSRLRLRGISSVTRGNDPVVIVDGIRIYAVQSEQRSGNLTNLGTVNAGIRDDADRNIPAPSPLDQIDPNIIDKIEVIKGASAATLYGADAANGVIVITTKKGRPGPVRWNGSLTHGRTVTPGRWPEGFYSWGHLPLDGGRAALCTSATIADETCVSDSLVRFQMLNAPDLTLLGKGQRTALSLTASGGSQSLTYSITGSYSDEVGLLKLPNFEAERFRTILSREVPDWMQRPHRLESWSVTSSVRALLGATADITLSTTLGRKDQQRSSLEGQIAKLAGTFIDPVTEIYYTPSSDGALNGAPLATSGSNLLTKYFQRTTASAIAFTTGLNAVWRPNSWFTGSADAGLNVMPRDDEFYQPTGLSSILSTAFADSGALIHGTGRSLVSSLGFRGGVRKALGKGFVFEAAAGAGVNTTRTDDLVSSAYGLQPGTSSIVGASSITATESRTNVSTFGWYIEPRITGERFALSTGLRLDGGSAHGARLSRDGGIGSLLSLPRVNASWVVSEEPWFPFTSLFSSLRIRAAYGQAQVQPGPTDRLRIYRGRDEPDGELIDLATLGNTELKPERSVEFEGGVDADLFGNRVTVELTAYQKTQIDALMPVSLPTSVNGGGSVVQNIGNIRNRGLELSLGFTPIQMPMLVWSAQLNYSRNTNTLVKLGRGVVTNKGIGLVEGYPVYGRWAKPILAYGDTNGNRLLETSEILVGDSLVYMGRLLPDYQTGLSTNVVLFGGALGIAADISYESGALQIDQTSRTNWVLSRALVDPTTPLSEQAPVVASRVAGLQATDYGLMQDVSTLRFSSLSVNYRVPARVAKFLRAQQLTIGIQGSNLGLHSTYDGKDPDVNAWSAGETIRDTGQLPQPRTWQLAVFAQY